MLAWTGRLLFAATAGLSALCLAGWQSSPQGWGRQTIGVLRASARDGLLRRIAKGATLLWWDAPTLLGLHRIIKVMECRFWNSFLHFLPTIIVDVRCREESISINNQHHTFTVIGWVLLLHILSSLTAVNSTTTLIKKLNIRLSNRDSRQSSVLPQNQS